MKYLYQSPSFKSPFHCHFRVAPDLPSACLYSPFGNSCRVCFVAVQNSGKENNSKNSESCRKRSCIVTIHAIENRRTANTSLPMGSSLETVILSATILLPYNCSWVYPIPPYLKHALIRSQVPEGQSGTSLWHAKRHLWVRKLRCTTEYPGGMFVPAQCWIHWYQVSHDSHVFSHPFLIVCSSGVLYLSSRAEGS